MRSFIAYLWRHPRRTGFIVFNALALLLFIGWGVFTERTAKDGISALPNVMLGYTGMLLLSAALLAGWIAWSVMVARRHMRSSAPPRSLQG